MTMEMREKNNIGAHPFIKWVGGKSQLLSEIETSLPKDFSRMSDIVYVEPFVGGGAVLFWILQHYPNITKAVINDINPKLICVYSTIQTNVSLLIDRLEEIQNEYIPLNADDRKSYYLEKRDVYNYGKLDDVEVSALFIFLNRTCFNGLYRVNSKGFFNVPHGRYANPRICDRDNLQSVSSLLQKVEILCGDYSHTIEYANNHSLFYFDPPYKPLSETSAFTSYTTGGFDDEEQLRLRDFCESIAARGSFFIASNSDPTNTNPSENFFDMIYDSFNIKRVLANRMINSVGTGRGAIKELLITNI